MIGILRGIGILNASVWFGASIFFTLFVGPAIFSDQVVSVLQRPYAGFVAQVLIERYFRLHLLCGLLAFAHLMAESLYLGRPLFRWTLSLLAGIFLLGLVGGYGIQPKLKRLHREMYHPSSPADRREEARKSFGRWHALSQVLNLLIIGGVGVYVVRVSRQGDSSRWRI